MKHGIWLILLVLLSGCLNTSRYSMKNDKAPLRKPSSLEMVDAVPEHLPIYPWSIKPYRVRGKHYTPLKSAEGYEQRGVASWYGSKFHGHLTANGETYDMYAMTAAHKTLPIPSFVRVTNLNNRKSIIVKVNDRGPFHNNRIIDLSYSAAYALDMLGNGVADVNVQAIVVKPDGTVIDPAQPPAPQPPLIAAQPQPTTQQSTPEQQKVDRLFVQVLASSDESRIKQLAQQLASAYRLSSQVPLENGIYKLRLGPLADKAAAQTLINALKNNGYGGAYMLYSEVSLPHN